MAKKGTVIKKVNRVTKVRGKSPQEELNQKETISHDWRQQDLDHRNDLKQRHQFVQDENFVDLYSEASGHLYPFITVEVEVPKFWRGDRAFFHPFRIELTWRQSGRRRVGYFKPKSDRYFVAVNSLEPIMGSDNKAWIREFPHPVRDGNKMLSAEALSLIEEFSETEQTLSFRVVVPLGCIECEGFLCPLELKLRYPGINHADLVFEYTRRIIRSSGAIKFTLTEEDVRKYSEVVLKAEELIQPTKVTEEVDVFQMYVLKSLLLIQY